METTQERNPRSAIHKNSTPESKLLEIKRDFNVPIENLFAAFETPEAIKAWWWPNGLYADRVELDFRKGGHFFINMKGFEKGGGGMVGEFEEITDHQRIVMSDRFADENGRAISAEEAHMKGVWPEIIYITLEFSRRDENTSRLHLSQEGIPNEMQDDCIQGWSQSFYKNEK
jgi:uncharacterized protein YndB with AHSA1/START domain